MANWLEQILAKAYIEPGFFRGPDGRRHLVVSGRPPRQKDLEKALQARETTGVQIRTLTEPDDANLAWLRPVLDLVRDVEILWPEGRVDVKELAAAKNLEALTVGAAVKGTVDLRDFVSPLRHLSFIGGRYGKFKNISALRSLESLAIDMPGSNLDFLPDLPNLREISLTAARGVRELPPMTQDQSVRKITLHQPRELSLDTIATYARSLEELVLDSVKNITHSDGIGSCNLMKRIEIEECGPQLNVSDFLYLMNHGKLRELRVVGTRLPFEKSEMSSLAGQSNCLVSLPPRFMK